MEKCIHLMSRQVAISLGISYYFTGKPCKRGHTYTRNTKNKTCHICVKGVYDEWYQRNGEIVRERNRPKSKKWANENREKVKSNAVRARNKIKNDPEEREKHNIYMRAANRKRNQHIKLGNTREIAEWIKKAEKKCYYCESNCSEKFHVDHFYPLSKGGKHALENLVISCPPCNLRKSNKCPHKFIDSLNK